MKKDNIVQFNKLFKKKEVSKLTKSGFALFNEGRCFYDNNKKLSLKKFEEAELAGYESAELFAYMSWLYGHFENFSKAKEYAFKALGIDDEYEHAYRLLGIYYFEQEKDYPQALKYLLLAEKYGCDFEYVYRMISEIYMTSDDFVNALKYATKAIYMDSSDGHSYYWKGYIYYYFGNYKKSLEYFIRSEKMGERFIDLYDVISHSYSILEDFDKALEYANKIVFLDKNSPLGYYRRGIVYYYTADSAKALEQFLLADKCGYNSLDLYQKIAHLYVDYKNELNTAVKWLKKGYKISKGDIDYNYYAIYISILGMMHRYKKALGFIDGALKKFPDIYNLWLFKAAIFQETKNYKDLEKCVRKLKRLEPDNPVTIFYQAVNLRNKPKDEVNYKRIISLLLKIKDSGVYDLCGAPLMGLAEAYCMTKQYEKSVDYFFEFFETKYYVEDLDKSDWKDAKRLFRNLYKKRPNDTKLVEILSKYPELL